MGQPIRSTRKPHWAFSDTTRCLRIQPNRPFKRFPKQQRHGVCPARALMPDYFLMPSPANFLLNFATWPPVSIMRCTPVQAGCDFGSMSRRSVSPCLAHAGPRLELRPVGHDDVDLVVFWVNARLHGVVPCWRRRSRPAAQAGPYSGRSPRAQDQVCLSSARRPVCLRWTHPDGATIRCRLHVIRPFLTHADPPARPSGRFQPPSCVARRFRWRAAGRVRRLGRVRPSGRQHRHRPVVQAIRCPGGSGRWR